jgi:capsular polysaccharide biosynthesis protein/Mrp family chromosome partitioning ATPase
MDQEQETFALRDVLRVLRRHRAVVLTAVAMMVLIALIVSFAQPKRYTAVTELVIGPVIPQVALPDARGDSKTGPLGLDLPAETQARIVASPMIAARVARGLKLPADPAHAAELAKAVKVKAVTDNILLITADAPSARQAAARANAFASNYILYRREAATRQLLGLAAAYRRQAKDVQLEVDSLTGQLKRVDSSSAEAQRLTVQRNAALNDQRALLSQAEAATQTVVSNLDGGQITASAAPPAEASSPNAIRNVLVGLLLGGVIGISLALFREHVNDRISTRDDAARASNAPVLGTIPRQRRFRQPEGELVTIRAPESPTSEAYRTLRSNLMRRGLGTRIRRLLITSVGAGPETSEVVANLAAACALAGIPTMAVSANLRQSQLHKRFGVLKAGEGLAGALTVENSANRMAVARALLAASIPNLSVLPAGRAMSSPEDVLETAPLDDIFGFATEVAQIVIIEAPSALRGGDLVTLAPHTDATLLLVRAGVDKEALTIRAAAILEMVNSDLEGVILYGARTDDDTVGSIEELWGARGRPATDAELEPSKLDGARHATVSSPQGERPQSGPWRPRRASQH